MRTNIIEEVKSSVKNWWLSLIMGILFVGVSIMILFNPLQGYEALAIVFSVCMFVCGIFEIIFSISNKKTLSGWGWYLVGGCLDLLLGFLLIGIPGLSMAMLPYLLAFWFMFRGFSAIGYAFDLNQFGVKNWGWTLVFGILAVICGIIIIFWPIAGVVTSVYIAAFAFLSIGIFRIMLAFELKSLKDNNEKLLAKLKELKQQ